MKTGMGLYKNYRKALAYFNLLRFSLLKYLVGFDYANQFLQRIDKVSLQLVLKKNGATIGNDCDIETGLIFHNCKNYKNLEIGNNCHIGKNCFFDLRDKVIIGNNVVVSMQCSFITHIDMSRSLLRDKYPASHAAVEVGDNCYLGAGTLILKGVRLSHNIISAAGCVITKNIESNNLIGGLPASVIKKIY